MDRELRMEIKGLMIDPSSNTPIVILRDLESQRFLPIWIGVFEANAIALRLEGVDTPRPMTHDLLRSSLERLGAEIEKIVICDLKEKTFFARIHLSGGEEDHPVVLDSRPSDALALAVRAECPIFAMTSVLDKAQASDITEEARDEERLKKWLEDVSPEDLGKYTM